MTGRLCCVRTLRNALVFVVGILLVTGVHAADPAVKAAGNAIGEISFSGGKVVVISAAGVERPATFNSPIYLNDKIVSGPGSKLEVTFSDKTVISLGENSEIIVDEYVFAPDRQKDVSFAMRFIRGACRIVTGAITKLNPERFKVHTRMATVGIRGCEIAVTGKAEKNDVYIMQLGKTELVAVEGTSNGKPIMDLATGRSLEIDEATRKVVNVDRTGTAVTIIEGKGISEREVEPGEIDVLLRGTSHMPAARYEPVFGADGSLIRLQPEKQGQIGKDSGAK